MIEFLIFLFGFVYASLELPWWGVILGLCFVIVFFIICLQESKSRSMLPPLRPKSKPVAPSGGTGVKPPASWERPSRRPSPQSSSRRDTSDNFVLLYPTYDFNTPASCDSGSSSSSCDSGSSSDGGSCGGSE